MEMTYDLERIRSVLPHRYPFLLVDRVVELVEPENKESRQGRRVVAIKNVTINEEFFQGHFPSQPVMPGVLIVEAMAQAGALASHREGERPMSVAIARIKDARFRRPVIPGDTLRLEAEVLRDKGKILVIGCSATVEGQVVAETEIVAHVTF